MELRENNVCYYSEFFTYFVKPVVGSTDWETRLLSLKLVPEDLCTPSDEAFALLLLENNFVRWLDIFEKNGHKVPRPDHQTTDRKKKSNLNANQFIPLVEMFTICRLKQRGQKVGHQREWYVLMIYTKR